jgi:mucin-2
VSLTELRMRIFTLLKAKTFFNLFLLVFLIGFSNQSYSQCPTVAITNQTFCDSQSPTVASLQASDNGGGIKWYATATSPASEFLLSTTPLESGETYYVDDNSGACGARQVVNVTIYSRPFALLAATTLCRESTIENLNPFVIGNNIKWYTTSTGGTALAAGTAISNGVYYASQTNPITGCETLRVGIVVEIKIVQPPTGVANQLICSDPAPTVANLVASGTNVSWFTTSTSGFPLDATTPLLNGQTYFAESFDSPCYSISRFPVTVTFASPNDAGTNGQINYCANQIASITPFDLYGLLNGNPDEGGVWTGPTITSNGYLGTVDVSSFTTAGSPYIYTYTVSSSINCPAVTSTITINVLPLPVASVSASPTTICENGNTALTFTGTPNAIVTYTVNGGTNQSTILNAGGTASINITLTADTVITIVSVASTGTPSCINTQPVTINITVEPLPTATVSANPTTICENGATTLTFTGTPNAIVTYTINGGANQSITLNTAGTATSNITLTADTVITIVSVATTGTPSCINTQPVTINITVEPLPTATVSANPTTICENGATTLTFTGTPNAIVTYTVNGGTNQTITLNATGTATSNITLTADSVITIVSVATTGTPSCINTQIVTINITVEPLPTASVSANPTTICENGASTLTFTGTPNAIVTYTVNGGTNQSITLNAAGTATSNITLTADTIITIVSVATTGTPSCINTQPVTINITVEPLPIAGVTPQPQVLCVTSPSIDLFTLLGNTAQTGGNWSPPLASGTGIFNPAIDVTGNYTYTVLGNSPCLPAEVTVQVTVNPIPNAGDDVADFVICSNQNPIDLFTLLGPNAQLGGTWSPALVSGTGILNPAVDTSQIYTYTVSGISPCVDDIATIGVTINQGPEAGNNNSVTLCVNSLPQDLFLALGSNAQPGGTWSPTLASGTGIFDPAIDLAGDYTYTLSGNDPCDNDEATITVIVNPIPDAGENGSHIFCTNDAPQDLFDFLTGTPQLGGTWSPTLASGTGVFDPMVDVAASYVYTVGGNLCDTDTATVTITVIQSPIAGADGVLTVCEDNTSLDLTLGLDGTQQAGIWSDDNATGALAGSIFNPSTVGVGTYVFTYTVNGGASPCTTDTATVTVTVNPLPNAGNFVPSSPICSSIGTFDLNTLLTGQDLGGNWLDATNTVITNPITVTSLLAGIHQYTYQVTNLCGVDNQLVQFEVLPKPQILTTNVTIAPVCIGNNVVVQFSGMADGTYTIVYDVTGVNTLTNQSQIITITSGTGSFTIPAASLTNVGNSTITFQNISNTVTNCQETLTNITSEIVIKPLLEVLANTVSVANTCVGNNVVVVFSNSNLPDGTYQFDYAITTGNPTSGNSGNVVFTGGNGQFIIPAAIFTTPGNYSMNITSIVSATECSNPNVTSTVNFVIETTPNSGTFNGIITICPADGTVDLFSLLDNENVGGVWTDVNSQVVTSPLNIANFAPATYSFTYTVTNSCSSVSTTVQFTILPTLNIAGATVSAQNTCVNFQSLVTISNATAIADGNYTITYVLSGANSFTETITIPIIGGSATFPLAQTSLTNAGSTTITITDIFLAGVTCGLNGVTFPAFTFEVQNLGTPSLVQEGNLFCETDNPTIANLSANILNGDTVVWFDAAIGGTAYDETDLLVHGTKYFAALVSQSGCEGSSHLEVIVDLTGCDDIVIPDGFSPNNDNINDTFEIKNLPIAYPNFKLEIFNRYGNLLYKGNKNTPNWDGTTSEKSLRVGSNYLPTGVYFYILYFNDGTRKPVQGRVYLSR